MPQQHCSSQRNPTSSGKEKRHVAAVVPITKKKPFICDLPATVLKRNAKLSKAARGLYCTMRSLANGKTDELAIRGNPLDWKYICRQAEIGRHTWQKALKELTSSGLVTCKRDRVVIYRNGRKRAVLGRAHYFVHRQPKTIKNPRILLKSDSCTVQESDPQFFSNTPRTASSVSEGFEVRVSGLEGREGQSKSPENADRTDKLSLTGEAWEDLRIESLQGEYRSFVEAVEANPRGEGEHFVLWAKRLMRLFKAEGINYPRVFLRRLGDAERALENQDDPYGEIARINTFNTLDSRWAHLMKDPAERRERTPEEQAAIDKVVEECKAKLRKGGAMKNQAMPSGTLRRSQKPAQ